MATLLHLDSSANRSSESVSRQLTALFAGTWQAIHGSAGYRYRDLTADPVPPLSTAYCVLGRRVERHGLVPPDGVAGLAKGPAEQQEWALTRLLITEIAGGRDSADWCPDVQLLGTRRAQGQDRPDELPRGLYRPPHRAEPAARYESRGDHCPGRRLRCWRSAGGLGFPDAISADLLRQARRDRRNVCFVSAEMTKAGLVPHLARFRPLAASSLAAARAEVTALATAITCSTGSEIA